MGGVPPPIVTGVLRAMATRGRRLACVAVMAGAACWWLAASASAHVYWANSSGNTIGRANPDGSGANERFVAGANDPFGIAVDAQHLYWTNFGTGSGHGSTIGRANLDGTGAEQRFITGADGPSATTVDRQHIYWTNIASGTIGRANLDGTGVDQRFITGANAPVGVAVDGQHIYWSNGGSNAIGRANLDGTRVSEDFISGADGVAGLAVDGQHIYWGNAGDGTIGRANIDGAGANQSFISGAGVPNGVSVDGQHIYWTDSNGSTIGRANIDGTGADPSFITGADHPYGLAVDSGVAGTPGGGGPGSGMPAPAPGCTTPSVDVPGVGSLHAGCFSYDKGSGTFSATGQVRFNGLDIVPLDPSAPNQLKVSIQPKSAQLTIEGDAQLKLGPIVVWKLKHEHLTYQLKVPGAAKARLVLNNIEQRVQATLKGFPIQGDISVDFSPENGGTISAGIHLALQKPIPNVTGDATLSLSNAQGLQLDNLEFKVPQAKLGPIAISDLDIKYDRSSDTWTGGLTASFPVTPRELVVKAGGKFVHGQFDSAYASAKGLGITLANPAVFLNDLNLSVSRQPKFEGGVAVTAGPELQVGSNKVRLLSLAGEFLFEQQNGHPHFRLSGNLVVLTDWGHVQGQIDYWPDTTALTFTGGFNFPDSGFPFPTFGFSASGGLNGGFKPGGFNVEGNATLKWEQHVDIGFVHQTISFEQGAQAVVSDRGIAVCHIGWPDVGLGFTWSSHDFTAFGSNCDISPWRSAAFSSSARAAALPAHAFLVRGRLPFVAFNVLGRAGVPPSITIRGPHGETAQTSADFAPVSGPKFLIMQIPSQSRTFVEVRDPAAGAWTITPTAGSAPVTGYQLGNPLPTPRVDARVSGRGSHRLLTWRLRAIRGQRVTFVEQGPRVDHALAIARASGRRGFVPSRGPSGMRTIVAQIEQSGLPRRNLVVARYRAPAPPRPQPLRGLRAIRTGRSVVVHWQRSVNATGYEVRTVLADGRRILAELPERRRSYRVGDLDPATGGEIAVVPLSGAAGSGRASRVRLRPPVHVLATHIPGTALRTHGLRFAVTPTQTGTLNIELINARGEIVRFDRVRARSNATREIGISLTRTVRGRYSLLLAYSLDGSFKPYTLLRQVQLR
jgi:virginiamycin B lyase